jgi:hypothetical protein
MTRAGGGLLDLIGLVILAMTPQQMGELLAGAGVAGRDRVPLRPLGLVVPALTLQQIGERVVSGEISSGDRVPQRLLGRGHRSMWRSTLNR